MKPSVWGSHMVGGVVNVWSIHPWGQTRRSLYVAHVWGPTVYREWLLHGDPHIVGSVSNESGGQTK